MTDETWDFDDGTAQGWTETEGANSTVEVAAAAALNGTTEGYSFTWDTTNTNDNTIAIDLANTYTTDFYVLFHLYDVTDDQFTTVSAVVECGESPFSIAGTLEITAATGAGGTFTLRENINDNGVTLNSEQDYEIEGRFVIDGSAGGWQVWVDGTLEIDDLTNDTSGTDVDWLRMGGNLTQGAYNSGSYRYIDEIAVFDERIGGGGGGGADFISKGRWRLRRHIPLLVR